MGLLTMINPLKSNFDNYFFYIVFMSLIYSNMLGQLAYIMNSESIFSEYIESDLEIISSTESSPQLLT